MTLSWMVQCEPNTQGTRNGTITIANNSANMTSLPVALTCSAIRGNLTVTSSTPFAYNTVGNRIDFGATFLGQTKMTTVTIGNDGNRPVTLVTPTVTASQGFTLGAPSGMTVPAGGSITLVVTFLPTLVTQGTATVTIASDWNTLAFEVTGDGQDNGTIFALDPPCLNGISTFSFAAPVAFDATASQQFCFKNLGEAPAQITGVQLIDTSPGGPNFTVSGIPLVAPFPTLARDQSRVFTITAVPNDTMLGTFTATLRITTTLPGADAVRDLTVTYTSSGPGLTVGPAMALAFGGVDVDAGPMLLPLTLQNTGTAPLPITNISPGPTGRFAIVGHPADLDRGRRHRDPHGQLRPRRRALERDHRVVDLHDQHRPVLPGRRGPADRGDDHADRLRRRPAHRGPRRRRPAGGGLRRRLPQPPRR
jgi:hypothetical protein